MKTITHRRIFLVGGMLFALLALATFASANHAWGTYHWARTASPFTLRLDDNVSSAWDAYLRTTSDDWSLSNVLDTVVLPGIVSPRRCNPVSGRVEVCNNKYGNNGWLGVASIWVNGSHITQGTVKVNDTYFNTTKYNTPAWRNMVMCQEVGHTFGLDHQDENFNNPPLGTCMDYTSDPTQNQHPNQHDFDMLETIYAHLDANTTTAAIPASLPLRGEQSGDVNDAQAWGAAIKNDARGRASLYRRDIPGDGSVFTFVIWTDEETPRTIHERTRGTR